MELRVSSGRKTIFNHSFIPTPLSLSLFFPPLHQLIRGVTLVIKSDSFTICNCQSRLSCHTLNLFLSLLLSFVISAQSLRPSSTLSTSMAVFQKFAPLLFIPDHHLISSISYFSARPEFTRSPLPSPSRSAPLIHHRHQCLHSIGWLSLSNNAFTSPLSHMMTFTMGSNHQRLSFSSIMHVQ